MAIRNPNEIVDKLVAGYYGAAGERLLSITLYGSAVSHEYRPGKSTVNIAVVLAEAPTGLLRVMAPVQAHWMRRGVAAPLYLTPQTIASVVDAYPVEFLDMRHAYRVIFGMDFLASLQLRKNALVLQCKRELSGCMLHLTLEFVRTCRTPRCLGVVLATSLRRLLPVFKAILVLYDRKIPSSTAEIIAAVEDTAGLGASVFSEIHNRGTVRKSSAAETYERFIATVEKLAGHMDRLYELVETPGTSYTEKHT